MLCLYNNGVIMILKHGHLEQIVAQARGDAPNETWGMIGGKNGRALKIYPMKNADDQPRIRYRAEPHQLLQVVREIEDEKQWDILAIYHSHPATEAYPSATDVREAHYPDSIYMLISLQNPDQAQVRGFRIVEGQVSEITLEIEDGSSRTSARRAAGRPFGKLRARPRAGGAVATLSKRRHARGNARRARR